MKSNVQRLHLSLLTQSHGSSKLVAHAHLLYQCFQAARETGALKEAKDKLEKRVEELTWRLQLEKRLRVILIP